SAEWLTTLLQQRCGIVQPRDFQVRHGMDLINGKDLFLVVAPGQGKTLVMYAPLLAAQALSQQGIAIIVAPTKLLTVQLSNGATKIGLRALAINEDTLRTAQYENHDLFKELAAGKDVRIAVMSPQMLSGERMNSFLRTASNKRQIRWFMVDEAHLVDEESTLWLEPYRGIKMMRARLVSGTIWAAFTGTATPSCSLAIAAGLGFRRGHYVDARYSVDRPNIKYITRFLEYPVSGAEFLDLAFLIPHDMTCAQDIPITLVFCNTIETGYRLMKFLDRLIPSTVPQRLKIVKLYNSLMPDNYRQKFVCDINSGTVLRIGICTDTCVYGFDVPGVRRTVNLGVPKSRQEAKQKDLRGGRDGSLAIAYSYAPDWVRDIPPETVQTKKEKHDAERRKKLEHDILLWFNPPPTMCPRRLDLESNGEVFEPRERWCSTCHPEPEVSSDATANAKWADILAASAPIKVASNVRSDGTYCALGVRTRQAFITMLLQWRGRVWKRTRGDCIDEPAQRFLPVFLINRLADKAHACTTYKKFEHVMTGWDSLSSHGVELFQWLTEILEGFKAARTQRTSENNIKVEEQDLKIVQHV
ncbi:nucleoside triphosphate hydrolase protein, partial [Wolfiporia cocos MD-104 SS10]